PKLEIVGFRHNHLDLSAAEILAQSHLDTLFLENNQIGDAGAIALAKGTQYPNLYLDNNEIGDEGAIALASNNSLNSLGLGQNKISNSGAIALSGATLFYLNVSDNQIEKEGIDALLFQSNINFLVLQGNPGYENDALI